MQIIYGREAPAHKGRRTWLNARFFVEVEPRATVVYLDGDYPAIRAAYEAAGVSVHDGLDEPVVKAARKPATKKPAKPKAKAAPPAFVAAPDEKITITRPAD